MGTPLYDMQKGITDWAALDAIKLEKLKKQIHRVYDQSPFHKARFDEVGFRPEMLKSLSDLKHVPFMTRTRSAHRRPNRRLPASHRWAVTSSATRVT